MTQDTAETPDDTDFHAPLNARLCELQHRINRSCARNNRNINEVRLLAVSKTRSDDEIRALYALGVNAFGENYLSEAQAKQARLGDLNIEWHFIGPLQSNKTAAIAQQFDWVQSVDREKIIRRLAAQRLPDQEPLNVLIQVNIDQEPQKSGCPPDAISQLADLISTHSTLKLRGLMAIPAVDAERSRAAFGLMRAAFEKLAAKYDTVDTLSIGMSGDLEAAIEQGSTMIRIGTALFGPRPTPTTDPA